VLLVFTRPPTDIEERELAAFRIKADGVVNHQQATGPLHTPSEYLAIRGRIVTSDTMLGVGVVSPILKMMEGTAKSRQGATN
jgi:hypothetical protein